MIPFLQAVLVVGVVLIGFTMMFYHIETGRFIWSAESRIVRRYNRQRQRQIASYIQLGMTPSDAARVVDEESARQSAAAMEIVRSTEALR